MKIRLLQLIGGIVIFIAFGASPSTKKHLVKEDPKIRLVVLSPAHPHGAHMQEAFRNEFYREVAVYAPSREDMQTSYLNLIGHYNRKVSEQDQWHLDVYTGSDYLKKMLSEKKGDMVLIASNNERKAEYIKKSAESGMSVLADKPMALTGNDFEKLEEAFKAAAARGNYISDLSSMSMRRFISYVVQKELSANPKVFGELLAGTADHPAVIQKNHHLYWKGTKRPPWFFDVKQQGNGLTDVTTHLIDIVQWNCFPGESIDYRKDIHIISAKTWATEITPVQFQKATSIGAYPEYLRQYGQDSILKIHSNGEINYRLKGTHVQIESTWSFEPVDGEKDSYESIIRGSKATLKIKAGNLTDLFIEPNDGDHALIGKALAANVKRLQTQYPDLTLSREKIGWRISSTATSIRREDRLMVPDKRERDNMLAKYYTTTTAYEKADRIGH